MVGYRCVAILVTVGTFEGMGDDLALVVARYLVCLEVVRTSSRGRSFGVLKPLLEDTLGSGLGRNIILRWWDANSLTTAILLPFRGCSGTQHYYSDIWK